MKATALVIKLQNDYTNTNLCIDSNLVYHFVYNGYVTHVYYTQEDNKENQLLLAIEIEDKLYVFSISIKKIVSAQ